MKTHGKLPGLQYGRSVGDWNEAKRQTNNKGKQVLSIASCRNIQLPSPVVSPACEFCYCWSAAAAVCCCTYSHVPRSHHHHRHQTGNRRRRRQQQLKMAAVDCFSIGSTVMCTTCFNEEFEGEVLAFDHNTKMLILSILFKPPTKFNQNKWYRIILNLNNTMHD